jgi:hypothetical protein
MLLFFTFFSWVSSFTFAFGLYKQDFFHLKCNCQRERLRLVSKNVDIMIVNIIFTTIFYIILQKLVTNGMPKWSLDIHLSEELITVSYRRSSQIISTLNIKST